MKDICDILLDYCFCDKREKERELNKFLNDLKLLDRLLLPHGGGCDMSVSCCRDGEDGNARRQVT